MIQETLDALDDGVARFDADMRLLVWNRPLESRMGYPPELMRRGTHFLDFVHFNIARGEHGPGSAGRLVRERLATIADRYQRRRPDGSLVRVCGRGLPDGGFIKVFTFHPADAGTPSMTAREREVLLWAAEGKTAWETGAILGLSAKTVEFHLANCARKLGATGKGATILAAARLGLLPL
ncbi:MAG: PAS-domain containing protein [Pseudomonadota bacterium]